MSSLLPEETYTFAYANGLSYNALGKISRYSLPFFTLSVITVAVLSTLEGALGFGHGAVTALPTAGTSNSAAISHFILVPPNA